MIYKIKACAITLLCLMATCTLLILNFMLVKSYYESTKEQVVNVRLHEEIK